ncbi:hypothetical protein LSTR_LSTR017327 [Laodelphax striatellus]|uniref:Uncharacterized protein n=1 Tax=Laodelphax striatellus TaxID=195883 RepID=A0A482WIE7_LAOST|nr:hypothetical protein LSTR_LSTR017327 [Laodelphax striatellus]
MPDLARPCQTQTVFVCVRLVPSDLVPFRMEKETALWSELDYRSLTNHRPIQITGRVTGHTGRSRYHRRHDIRVRLAVCDRLGLWDLGF